MKGFYKLFSVAVVFCIIITGCKKGQQSQADDELYTIQVLTDSTTVGGINRSDDTKIGKYIRDKFGIVFEYVLYAGDIREKQSLMLAAGDYQEMQNMQQDDMVLNYVNAGVLIDLLPYLSGMPNFSSRFKEQISYWRLSCGGPLYKWETSVPTTIDTNISVLDIMIRSDLLEKAGWPNPLPLSASDWVKFLEKVVPGAVDVNGNPIEGITLPLAESWGMSGLAPILFEKGENYYDISNEGFIFDQTNDQFVDYFKNKHVKESFKFFSDLYRRNLLDLECFTDTFDITMEKASSGSAAAVFYISWEKDSINTALRASGHPEMQYVNLPIQTDSQVANGEKRMVRQDRILSHDSWGLTNKCRNPEKLLALIDWACSDEGQIILNSGFEGEHWIRDSNGKRVWTDLFIQAKTDPSVNKTEGLGLMRGLPYFKVRAADGQPHDLTMEMEWIDGQGLSDREKEVFQKLGWSSSLDWYLDHLKIIQTGLERTVYINPASDLGDIHTKMTETRVKYTAPIMMAKTDAEFETAYQAAMAEYDRLDHQAVIDELNRLYREQANELKKYE